MIKQTIKLDQNLLNEVYALRRQVAEVAAGIVADEFMELLYDAPQRSGNYVANMAVAAGSSLGRKGGQLYFPLKKSTDELFTRGNLPAVFKAAEENKNILKNIANSIGTKAGWCPAITVYNRLAYAEVVEGYTEEELRAENSAGAHAVMKFKARLEIRINKHVVEGSPEWHYLIGRGKEL